MMNDFYLCEERAVEGEIGGAGGGGGRSLDEYGMQW